MLMDDYEKEQAPKIAAINARHSPATLKRMGWSYHDTESSARRVAD
jgi:hypothetical protein